MAELVRKGFKPYYNWITFNTVQAYTYQCKCGSKIVLNLIITGLPSILSF